MPVWTYFLLTLLVELPIVCTSFRQQWRQALLVGFLLNLFTWPLLHLIIFSCNIDINILEIGVAVTEALGYWLLLKCSFKKALLVSFLANGISYGIGLVINYFLL